MTSEALQKTEKLLIISSLAHFNHYSIMMSTSIAFSYIMAEMFSMLSAAEVLYVGMVFKQTALNVLNHCMHL